MNKDEFKRRFTAGWKMERCIDFDQALEGLLADARLERVAYCPEWSILEADDPFRLDMHDDEEGDR